MPGWAKTFALLAVSCGYEGEGTLLVELQTDFSPGVEFVAVRTSVVQDGIRQEVFRATGESFTQPRRVAEFRGVPVGDQLVLVELVDEGGRQVHERKVLVTLGDGESQVTTVQATRDCESIRCPRAFDSPTDLACVGGECVDPRCTPESPELCAPECSADEDCPTPTNPCAAGRCFQGVCFLADEALCEDGAACHPERGCEPVVSVQEPAVEVVGFDTFHADETDVVSLAPVTSTRVGDVVWAIILRDGSSTNPDPTQISPRAPFELRQHAAFACGFRGTTIDVFSLVVTQTPGAALEFTLSKPSLVSAALVTFRGLSGGLDASTLASFTANPIGFQPLDSGPTPALGLLVHFSSPMPTSAGFRTYAIPEGMERVLDFFNVAVFTKEVGAREVFVDRTGAVTPESCGFAYAALLNLR